MGPVISLSSRERIHGMIEKAIAQGATIVTGGNFPTMPKPFDKGSYYSPTVIKVDTSMEIWREEVISF
jgi:acyl-CoA reductase-like NAD-dependent aldehyde dehydrogenase